MRTTGSCRATRGQGSSVGTLPPSVLLEEGMTLWGVNTDVIECFLFIMELFLCYLNNSYIKTFSSLCGLDAVTFDISATFSYLASLATSSSLK